MLQVNMVKKEKKEQYQLNEHPVIDTPHHVVPQVVRYPKDTQKDIEGLYNSGATKFEKKIPNANCRSLMYK